MTNENEEAKKVAEAKKVEAKKAEAKKAEAVKKAEVKRQEKAVKKAEELSKRTYTLLAIPATPTESDNVGFIQFDGLTRNEAMVTANVMKERDYVVTLTEKTNKTVEIK